MVEVEVEHYLVTTNKIAHDGGMSTPTVFGLYIFRNQLVRLKHSNPLG